MTDGGSDSGSGGESGLRARLVATGVELVSGEGAAAVSLREIARRAGVSHGAPRRYFPTHLDLLSAIAREGFAELGGRVAEVLGDGRAEAREQVAALARVYVGFGLERPGMYELMFRHDVLDSGPLGLGLREASLPLFGVLVGLVEKVRGNGEADAGVVAGALWANLHGIVQLWRWGALRLAVPGVGAGVGAGAVEVLVGAAVDAHLGVGVG